MSSCPYSAEANIVSRFFNLARIATVPNNDYEYNRNIGEKIAKCMLYHVEQLPKKITGFMKDPRIITIVLAALAITAVSFAFYPVTTILYAKIAIAAIPFPPAWVLKFATYITCVETIVGYALRAESRFMNDNLLNKIEGYKK